MTNSHWPCLCVHDGDDSEDDDGADDDAVWDDELEYIESEPAGKLPPLSAQHLSYTHNSEVGGNLWYATGMQRDRGITAPNLCIPFHPVIVSQSVSQDVIYNGNCYSRVGGGRG